MNGAGPVAGSHPPRPSRSQYLGAILWPSFFAAGVATMVFFALFDPVVLFGIAFPGREIGRELGYTAGFFLFWLATAAASLFTSILLQPPVAAGPPQARD
jgi:hypothetical protein